MMTLMAGVGRDPVVTSVNRGFELELFKDMANVQNNSIGVEVE